MYKILLFYPGKIREYQNLLENKTNNLDIHYCSNAEEVSSHIDEVEIILTSIKFPVEKIQKAENLKWVQVLGAGVDVFTAENMLPEGVILTRVNKGFGPKIAEYVLAHILSITQSIPEIRQNQASKKWEQLDTSWVSKEVIGIVGLGKIGKKVAKKAKRLDMKVLGVDVNESDYRFLDRFYALESFEEFLKAPRFVVLCVPLNPKTREMFRERHFDYMRDDGIFINVSRGEVVNQGDLVHALQSELIQGAVLDVFEEEPLPKTSPLWEMRNVVVTPHIAGPSVPEEMVKFFIENLRRFREGKDLLGEVALK